MSNVNPNEMLLRQRIAANVAHYRKLNSMTQSELAERIAYSDKSVSKWERAEGMPDIYVLTLLAGLFSVTVNDLISENTTLPPPAAVNINKNRVLILLLLVGLAWLVATVTYTVLQIFAPSFVWAWYSFIFAIPVTCIIAVVLTSLWWSLKFRFIAVSALVWAIAATVYLLIPLSNVDLIFAIAAVLQVLVILWFIFIKQLKKMKHNFMDRNSRRHRV
jgi:transcriptional regulator with XRE-family HTH domain